MARADRDQARLTIIYWRDIPAQVTAREGRRRAGTQLPDRFQAAIDQAATRAGKTATDEYLAEWREEARPCDGDLEAAVKAEAARLQAEFSSEALDAYVRNQGWAP